MPRYVIERNLPGAGKLSQDEIRAVAQRSCGVLLELGSDIQWIESYVTEDRIYCVYIAPDEAAVRTHAERGGFPATRVTRIRGMIDPTTAE